MIFKVDKEAVRQVLLPVLPISPVSNMLSIIHTGLPIFILMLVISEGRAGEISEHSKKRSFGYSGTLDREVISHIIIFYHKSEHWYNDNRRAQSDV